MTDEDAALMPAVMELIARLEHKYSLIGVHDNLRFQGAWLWLYPDGSGFVMGDYSKATAREHHAQRLLRTVMTLEPAELMGFDSVQELHGQLVAATMTVKG